MLGKFDVWELHGWKVILGDVGSTETTFIEVITGRNSKISNWYLKEYGKFIGSEHV